MPKRQPTNAELAKQITALKTQQDTRHKENKEGLKMVRSEIGALGSVFHQFEESVKKQLGEWHDYQVYKRAEEAIKAKYGIKEGILSGGIKWSAKNIVAVVTVAGSIIYLGLQIISKLVDRQ